MSPKVSDEVIKEFFDQALQKHGASPLGVHWNSVRSQVLRFEQLVKVIDTRREFSLNDWGCGYGALIYLRQQGCKFTYTGYDLLPSMLERARQEYAGCAACTFVDREEDLPVADYTVASGIFNFKGESDDADWQAYVLDILHKMDAVSKRGFSFNMLTTYSDPEYMRPELFYANPGFMFDYCKTHFSRQVALLHDYELYDFTILVRKP
jgi:hypothetical protein